MSDETSREVYFEFTAIGAAMRVAAIDSATGIEVTVMGPVLPALMAVVPPPPPPTAPIAQP